MQKMLGNKKVIALFTLPTLLVFSVVVFYPILQTLYRSFYDWDGLTAPIFTVFLFYSGRIVCYFGVSALVFHL